MRHREIELGSWLSACPLAKRIPCKDESKHGAVVWLLALDKAKLRQSHLTPSTKL